MTHAFLDELPVFGGKLQRRALRERIASRGAGLTLWPAAAESRPVEGSAEES